MRVNIYSEELTDRVELISKEIEGRTYTAVRFYLYLPVTTGGCSVENVGAPIHEHYGPDRSPVYTADGRQLEHIRGPFIHHAGDDDSSAVTFWGKQDLRKLLQKALDLLDKHYEGKS